MVTTSNNNDVSFTQICTTVELAPLLHEGTCDWPNVVCFQVEHKNCVWKRLFFQMTTDDVDVNSIGGDSTVSRYLKLSSRQLLPGFSHQVLNWRVLGSWIRFSTDGDQSKSLSWNRCRKTSKLIHGSYWAPIKIAPQAVADTACCA